MKLKTELYKKEQEIIQAKVVDLLGLNNNSTYLLSDLDLNEELQNQLMELSSDIKKYYNCNNFKAITEPLRIKRPWLSIIKTILKPIYEIKSTDYHFTKDRKHIHTQKYTFTRLCAVLTIENNDECEKCRLYNVTKEDIPTPFTNEECDNCTQFMKFLFKNKAQKTGVKSGYALDEFEVYLRNYKLPEAYIERLKHILLRNDPPWTSIEINHLTLNKTQCCPIYLSLMSCSGIKDFPTQQEICDLGLGVIEVYKDLLK